MKEIFYERNIMYVLQWVTLYNFMIIYSLIKLTSAVRTWMTPLTPKA